MAALDFPNAPTLNQVATLTNGFTYQWDGTVWIPAATAPGQTAGGDLTGTYPSPTIAPLAVTVAKTAIGATVRGSVNVALPLSYATGSAGTWLNVATTPAMVTRGGPVLLTLVVGGSILTNSITAAYCYYGLYRDGAIIIGWRNLIQSPGGYIFAPAPSAMWVDAAPSAASHTYGFWVNAGPTTATQFATAGDTAGQLVATELA